MNDWQYAEIMFQYILLVSVISWFSLDFLNAFVNVLSLRLRAFIWLKIQ